MVLTSDVILKGDDWRIATEKFSTFFDIKSQPYYSLFIISASIGIMYDVQKDCAGVEEESENPLSVPRTVLIQHNTELDFMFQTAILSSKNVDFDEKTRMDLAFNTETENTFNKINFITKFANFGVSKLLEQIGINNIDTMDKIKEFLNSTIKGMNFDIDSFPEESLDIDDLN